MTQKKNRSKGKLLLAMETQISPKDFHRFLYLATFRRTQWLMQVLLAMSAIGACIVAYQDQTFYPLVFLMMFVFYCVLCFGGVALTVEWRNRKQAPKSTLHLQYLFYKEQLELQVPGEEPTVWQYDNLYRVLESRRYLVFYGTVTEAFVLRKEDIPGDERRELLEMLQEKLHRRYRKA